MKFKKDKPYNELPLLPPQADLNSRAILRKAISAHKNLAELKGVAHIIPNQTVLINSIILQEARLSSEIENVVTTDDKLYKAFASSAKNVDPQTKEVLHYREALWAGYNELKSRQLLATNLFIKTFNIIKQTNERVRNAPGTRIINGRGSVVYSPPEGEDLIIEKLKNLDEFIHNDKDEFDPIVKLAVIHYQFEAIHPFTDGNGRTGRIINVLYLLYKRLLDLPILYLSRYIIQYKAQYYRHLRNVTAKNEWGPWILYMLDAVEKTSLETKKKILRIKDLMDQTLKDAREKLPSYVYSKELVELLFEQPYCKVQFVVDKGIAKRQRASVYLMELEKIGILTKKKVGKENLFLNLKFYRLLKE